MLRWPDRDKVLEAVRSWASAEHRSHPELCRLGIFGSYARGDCGVGSDLDLVAVVRTDPSPFIERSRRWAVERLPLPADLLVYTEEEWNRLIRSGVRFARVLAEEVVWILGSQDS